MRVSRSHTSVDNCCARLLQTPPRAKALQPTTKSSLQRIAIFQTYNTRSLPTTFKFPSCWGRAPFWEVWESQHATYAGSPSVRSSVQECFTWCPVVDTYSCSTQLDACLHHRHCWIGSSSFHPRLGRSKRAPADQAATAERQER